MNYQDDIPLARRIKSIKTITNKSFLRMGLLFLGLGISVTFLANKSFLSQRKSLDDSSNSIETRQNKSLLGHLPYTEASKKDLILFSPGIYVHKDIYENFKEMQFMAAQRGVSLQLLSGYRSINLQHDIFYSLKSIRNQEAAERARVSAPPGYSEHSTGFAIDIGDATQRETDFETEFENTDAFKWLINNAAKYHFKLSFTQDNEYIDYEPWHWRYEGSIEALKVFESSNRKS